MGPDELSIPCVTSVNYDSEARTIDVTFQADSSADARPFIRAIDFDGDVAAYAQLNEMMPNTGISFDLLGMVQRMSNDEKRELLYTLVKAFDDIEPEIKPPQKVSILKRLFPNLKK